MQAVGRNIFSLGLSRITSGVILFFVQAKLAAYLGPHSFGQLSLVLAFYTIFLLFIDAGISKYVIKKVSEDKSASHAYYGNFLIAQFFLALAVFALFMLIPNLLGYEPVVTHAMYVAGAGLLLTAMIQPALAMIQAWQKIHIFAAITFAESLAKAAWFLYAIFADRDIVFIFIIYPIVGLFDILVYAFVTRKIARPVSHQGGPKFILDRALVRKMFLYGVPFALLSGFEIMIAKVDSIIQKFFLPYSEIGQYAVAYRFLDFLTFLPAIVAISLFPVFSEAADLNTEATRAMIKKINRLMMALAIPMGLFVTLFAENIILMLFGDGYVGAVRPFQILIWATAITLMYAVPNVIMQVKRTRLAIAILAGTTAFNIAANILLIPRFGIIASAWLTVLSYVLAGSLYVYYSRKLVKFSL